MTRLLFELARQCVQVERERDEYVLDAKDRIGAFLLLVLDLGRDILANHVLANIHEHGLDTGAREQPIDGVRYLLYLEHVDNVGRYDVNVRLVQYGLHLAHRYALEQAEHNDAHHEHEEDKHNRIVHLYRNNGKKCTLRTESSAK